MGGRVRPCLPAVEKARCAIFSAEEMHRLPTRLTARRAANGVRKALLRKAAEPTAHVAGFRNHLEDCGPPNLPLRFLNKLGAGFVPASSFISE